MLDREVTDILIVLIGILGWIATMMLLFLFLPDRRLKSEDLNNEQDNRQDK